MQSFAQLTVWRSQEPRGRYDGQRQLSVRLSCCTHLGVTLSQFSTCLLWLGWHCADNQPGLSLPTCFRASEDLEPAILHHRGFVLFQEQTVVLKLPQFLFPPAWVVRNSPRPTATRSR